MSNFNAWTKKPNISNNAQLQQQQAPNIQSYQVQQQPNRNINQIHQQNYQQTNYNNYQNEPKQQQISSNNIEQQSTTQQQQTTNIITQSQIIPGTSTTTTTQQISNTNENEINNNDINKNETKINENNEQTNEINDNNIDNNNNNNENKQEINDIKRRSPTNQNTSNALLMFHGSKYEIKCDETFAYYDGYIIDYDEKDKSLSVLFDNDWKQPQRVPLDYVRPLPPKVNRDKWKPKPSDKVECKAKAEESEPYGWWSCKISTVRDNLYLITYEGWENHHEVLQPNYLRPYNPHPCFDINSKIIREEKPIEPPNTRTYYGQQPLNPSDPKYIKLKEEMLRWILQPSTHEKLQNIKEKCGLIHLGYRPDINKLLFIGTPKQVRNSKSLVKYLWELKLKYEKKEIELKKLEVKLNEEYEELSKCFKLKFVFDDMLTKYVIGRDGNNINKAKSIDGVRHINVENGECLILADDENSAQEAQELLEIVIDSVEVPSNTVKNIIGPNGANVKKMEEKTHVNLVSTMSRYRKFLEKSNSNALNDEFYMDCDRESGKSKIVIIGPKINVDTAKQFLFTQIESIKQENELKGRYNMANQELMQNNSFNNGINNDGGISQRRRRQQQLNKGNIGSNKDVRDYNYTQKKRYNNNIGNNNNDINDENKALSDNINDTNEINDQNDTNNIGGVGGGQQGQSWDTFQDDDEDDQQHHQNNENNTNIDNDDEYEHWNENNEDNNEYNNELNENNNNENEMNYNKYGNYNKQPNNRRGNNRGRRGNNNYNNNNNNNRSRGSSRVYNKPQYVRKTKPNNEN